MNRSLALTALVAATPILLAGCPTPLTWTTPRTIPAGEVNHTVGLEVIRLTNLDDPIEDETETAGLTLDLEAPPVPFLAYLIRFGVSDEIDIGVKVSTSTSFAVDFKFQVVREDVFDLALDPGIQTTVLLLNYLNFPILMGFNLGDIATITLAPRVSYLTSLDEDFGGILLYGGTAGVRLGVTDGFAVIPQVDISRPFDQRAAWILNQVTFGIGFSFGDQPQYGEPAPPEAPVVGNPPAAPPPAAVPAPDGGIPVIQNVPQQ